MEKIPQKNLTLKPTLTLNPKTKGWSQVPQPLWGRIITFSRQLSQLVEVHAVSLTSKCFMAIKN